MQIIKGYVAMVSRVGLLVSNLQTFSDAKHSVIINKTLTIQLLKGKICTSSRFSFCTTFLRLLCKSEYRK